MVFRLSYVFAEAYRGFRRNLLLAGSMVIIVAISLTLFGIALLAGKQVHQHEEDEQRDEPSELLTGHRHDSSPGAAAHRRTASRPLPTARAPRRAADAPATMAPLP